MDHHHADVRTVGRQMLAQTRSGFDHIHPPANQRGGVAQLFFQVLPVIDEHDLVIGKVATGTQHSGQKHHGQ